MVVFALRKSDWKSIIICAKRRGEGWRGGSNGNEERASDEEEVWNYDEESDYEESRKILVEEAVSIGIGGGSE